jgi:hypothetical protein
VATDAGGQTVQSRGRFLHEKQIRFLRGNEMGDIRHGRPDAVQQIPADNLHELVGFTSWPAS